MKRKPDAVEIVLGVIILAAVFFVFLSRGESSGGDVAIVDLDRVAQALGRDMMIKQAMQERKASVEAELQRLQASQRDKYEAKKKSFGEEPTAEQQQELQNLAQELDTAVKQALLQSRQALDRSKQELSTAFRDEVQPVAAQVAAQQGARLVVMPNPNFLLSVDPSLDITDEVIEQIEQGSP